MKRLLSLLKSYAAGQSGAVAVEYVLIASAMGVAIIVTMPTLTSAWELSIGNIAGYFP